MIEQRCASNPLLGRPYKIATVDKYQGQQNDFVLLSLVRTKIVGHLRDVRRLVVAMSRARLGLYVFGRRSIFESCYELQPTFKQLLSRPTQLALVKGESYINSSLQQLSIARRTADEVPFDLISGPVEMAQLVGRRLYEISQQQTRIEEPHAAVSDSVIV